MNNNVEETTIDSRKYIGLMPELQREQAFLTMDAATTLADQFFHNYTIICLEAMVNNLANHSAPDWSTILEARLYMAQGYAKTVAEIVGMVAPKFMGGEAMEIIVRSGDDTSKGRAPFG